MPPRRSPNVQTETDAPAAVEGETETVPVLLWRDYWTGPDERHKAGTQIMLKPADARRLINLGKAERADPMPGEEG